MSDAPEAGRKQKYLLAQEGVDRLLRRIGVELLQALLMIVGEPGFYGLPHLLRREPRPGSNQYAEPAPAGTVESLDVHRRRDIDVDHRSGRGAEVALGRYAYDLVAAVSHGKGFAEHAGVAGETAGPEVVTENRDGMASWRDVVIRRDQAAGSRVQAEHAEEVAGDVLDKPAPVRRRTRTARPPAFRYRPEEGRRDPPQP